MGFGLSPIEMIVVAVLAFAGLGSSPVGVPQPADEGLQSASPPECLAYFAYHGITKPEKSSRNQIEQLLAEDEIQSFASELMRLADEGLSVIPAADADQSLALRALPPLAKAFLSRPSILYVSQVAVPPAQPSANGAVVLNAGDEFAAVKESLDELESLYCRNTPGKQAAVPSTVDGVELRRLPTPPGVPPVQWGAKQPYVFLAVGEGEAAAIVGRLKNRGAAPAWLTKASADLGVKRPGLFAFLDIARIWKLCEPMIRAAAEQERTPDAQRILKAIEALGLNRLDRVAWTSGLDDEASVSKLLISSLPGSAGVAASSSSGALSISDFKSIPGEANFAWVGSFDAAAAWRQLRSAIEQADPDTAQQVIGVLSLIELQLGFSVERDLLSGLGNQWSIYNSTREGGMLLTGLCATAKVRDRAKVTKAIDQSLEKLRALTVDRQGKPTFTIRTSAVGSKTIAYVQIAASSPVAPAWCLTDDILVVAPSPAMVRTHLMRSPEENSLSSVEAIAKKLATGDVTSLSYSNPQMSLETIYSYAQLMATAGAGMLEQNTGIQADIAKFPSLACLMRHVKPTIGISRTIKTGLLFETYSTVPIGGDMSVPAVGVAVGLLLPAVQNAREQGRKMARQNEERQRAIERQLGE